MQTVQTKKRGELLFSITKKDFDIKTMRAGGKGGQHQNVTDSAVRITHRASGAVGESRSERSQSTNKKLAFKHLINSPKFKAWFKIESSCRLQGRKDIERQVDDAMNEKNIRVEYL